MNQERVRLWVQASESQEDEGVEVESCLNDTGVCFDIG